VRRPDIRAARRRIEAADQRVAAAIADRLPHFTLSGSIGLSSPTIEGLLTSFVYSLAAGVFAPLFDGERREAVVQQQHAVVWERTELLAHTMLTAVQEVEVSLIQERHQRDQIELLEASLASRRAALSEARQRFAEGLIPDYLNVLTSLSAAQQAEQSLLAAQRQLVSFRVQLHRALGGSWTAELEMPEPHRPVAESDDEEE
jgi:outer membrane protein TolC